MLTSATFQLHCAKSLQLTCESQVRNPLSLNYDFCTFLHNDILRCPQPLESFIGYFFLIYLDGPGFIGYFYLIYLDSPGPAEVVGEGNGIPVLYSDWPRLVFLIHVLKNNKINIYLIQYNGRKAQLVHAISLHLHVYNLFTFWL